MGTKRILGAPVWPHWVITTGAFALFAEYLRLVVTSDTPAYRIGVMIVLGIAFAASLIRLLKARHHPRGSTSG